MPAGITLLTDSTEPDCSWGGGGTRQKAVPGPPGWGFRMGLTTPACKLTLVKLQKLQQLLQVWALLKTLANQQAG